MKTSNYIAISFLIFLFSGIFILFLSAKIHQRDNNAGLWVSDEKMLDPFSVVVAESGANFNLRTGEYPRIICSYQKPDTCSFSPFGIRNDTLFVFARPGIDKHPNPNVIYGKNIKSIVAKEKSYIRLEEFKADTLFIKLDKTVSDMFFDEVKNHTTLLSIQAVESQIYLAGANVEQADIQLNKTNMNVWNNSIGSLSGTLRNHSEIQGRITKKINLELDSTSNYNINK